MKTITFKLAGETEQVKVEFVSITDDWMSIVVDTKEDALKVCFYYRAQPFTKIDKTGDGRFMVVVYKNTERGNAMWKGQ